jgi:hypothetical protein
MGAWGHGIYENDTAGDWGAEMGRHLLAQASEVIDRHDLSVADLDLVFARLDVVCYICENADSYPFEGFDINAWRTKVLNLFDQRWEGSGHESETAARRRKVIVDLFDRINRLVEKADR